MPRRLQTVISNDLYVAIERCARVMDLTVHQMVRRILEDVFLPSVLGRVQRPLRTAPVTKENRDG